ncbi:hypothetical protein MNBD_GAMMA16-2063 [hydrothermal vent metagenome]|uniref:ATP-grasp fold RimK-type domain-containing protein n=1 Tax=hydrothermal vent metagenome TaxID=652676 RepID=A0A3B0YW57_9ZZZZ
MASLSSPIVIVGSLADEHVLAVQAGLIELGHKPLIFDALGFPGNLPISMSQDGDAITIRGQNVGHPAAVYVRSLYQDPVAYGVDVEDEMKDDWRRTLMAFRESSTLLTSILYRWEHLGVPMFNPPSAQINITKPYQLALLAEAGLPVPDTLWSNNPAAVKTFCEHEERIYKPVTGGAATLKVSREDLTNERLRKLASAPVTFQEWLPGDDIRVYIIDGRVVCSLRIVSDAIDFRQNEQHIEVIKLPTEIERQCLTAMEVIGLRFTGLDLKADIQGQYKILELNPSAMFLGFEQWAEVDICRPLCEAIIKHAIRKKW